MKSSTITAEDAAREEWVSMQSPDLVRVRVGVRWIGDICVPSAEEQETVSAIFGIFTFGDNFVIEKATTVSVVVGDRGEEVSAQEPNEFRRLMIKKSLLSWSLPIPIERENGWMKPECYRHVSRVAGPLMDALLDEFQKTTVITENEERVIDRQSAILFSESSRGVANACEAISTFCTLGSFWEKFGINKENLPALPFREYVMLKAMMRKEGDAMRVRTKPKSSGGTKIAGPGGRPRASTGKRISL